MYVVWVWIRIERRCQIIASSFFFRQSSHNWLIGTVIMIMKRDVKFVVIVENYEKLEFLICDNYGRHLLFLRHLLETFYPIGDILPYQRHLLTILIPISDIYWRLFLLLATSIGDISEISYFWPHFSPLATHELNYFLSATFSDV